MTAGDRVALDLVSRLLDYPDGRFYEGLSELEEDAREFLPMDSSSLSLLLGAVDALRQMDEKEAQETYVATFDQDPGASLYMAWHRYGNDRGQGKALAALNGLYRAAGIEPEFGAMPDYLPRMLEFMAVADEWAVETLLDGFGPEINRVVNHLKEQGSLYGLPLEAALLPLQNKWPGRFKPRNTPDPTARPMAKPAPEDFDSSSASIYLPENNI